MIVEYRWTTPLTSCLGVRHKAIRLAIDAPEKAIVSKNKVKVLFHLKFLINLNLLIQPFPILVTKAPK